MINGLSGGSDAGEKAIENFLRGRSMVVTGANAFV